MRGAMDETTKKYMKKNEFDACGVCIVNKEQTTSTPIRVNTIKFQVEK